VELGVNINEFVNVEDAMRRIGGNTDLYKRLLLRFIEGNNLEKLETALARGDIEESAYLIHALKGVSANLSLIGISAASTNLEQSIKDGLDFSEQLAKLKLVFNATLEIISEMVKY
jgi:HPt (histidine-containing phosphotransfer) domain-containing protein